MKLDRLFDLLHECGGGTVVLYPQTDDGKTLGVVVAVSDAHAQAFLEYMEGWHKPKPNSYGWDDDE